MKQNKHQIAYTLIELLVVISIIQLLATFILVSTYRARLRGQYAKAIADLTNIRRGIDLLIQDTGKLPFGCPLGEKADRELQLSMPESGLFTRPTPQVLYNKYHYDHTIHVNPPPPGYSHTEYVAIGGYCEWTADDASNWNGPYVPTNGVRDPWNWPYVFDRDYEDPYDATNIYIAIFTWGPPRGGNRTKEVAIPLDVYVVNPIRFP